MRPEDIWILPPAGGYDKQFRNDAAVIDDDDDDDGAEPWRQLDIVFNPVDGEAKP